MNIKELTLEKALEIIKKCDFTEEEFEIIREMFNEESLELVKEEVGEKRDFESLKEALDWVALSVLAIEKNGGDVPCSIPVYLHHLTKEQLKALTQKERDKLRKEWEERGNVF